MSKCLKCDVNVNTVTNKCPLCDSIIDETKDCLYPKKINGLKYGFVRKISLFIALMCSLCVVLLNFYLTPTYRWSVFVIIQLFISYMIFFKILNGRNRVLRMLFMLNIFVCSLSIFWDIYTGFHGWSVNYVLPALCISYGIFMLILRLVRYYAFKENSSYIYLNICLEFLPAILVYFNYAKPNVLIYLSMIFGILNLLMLLAFDGSSFKDDIVKKLHI